MPRSIKGYENCYGCGVCTLPCPIWQQRHDTFLTFAGRAMALLGGAEAGELKDSVDACLLCGSCEPACPVGIPTVDITLNLRSELSGVTQGDLPKVEVERSSPGTSMIFPDLSLKKEKELLNLSASLLNMPVAEDCGSDILEAFKRGLTLSDERTLAFLRTVAGLHYAVVADGLFKRLLRVMLPGLKVQGLGEAMLRFSKVQNALGPTDLYIIEARSYNTDFKRCMPFYTEVSRKTGCAMNMDLQRIAIPTGSYCGSGAGSRYVPDCREQIRWILEARIFNRIIVETADDLTLFRNAVDVPVLHVAELAGEKDR